MNVVVMHSENIFYKFHENHGEHIILSEKASVAYRSKNFDNGVVFSEKYLEPGELFVIEVEENELCWNSYLRLGLTQINPKVFSANRMQIPKHAVPDFMKLDHHSWIYGLSDLLPNIRELSWPYDIQNQNIRVSENYIQTCRGSYLRSALQNSTTENDDDGTSSDRVKSIDVGFKVGVLYIPTDDQIADLYFVINGDLLGPYAVDIPYRDVPLYVVADVYGKTKKIRRLQVQADQSLKQLCRVTIQRTYDMGKINTSSLPKQIIDYLNFKSNIL